MPFTSLRFNSVSFVLSHLLKHHQAEAVVVSLMKRHNAAFESIVARAAPEDPGRASLGGGKAGGTV